MKLVYLCDEYPPAPTGGIGTFTRGLARAMVRHGHEVHVVGHHSQQAESQEVDQGVQVWRLPAHCGAFAPLRRRWATHRALRAIAEGGSIDILEAPDFEGSSAFLPRCSRGRVVRLHGSHRYFSDERNAAHSRSVAFFEQHALRAADAIVSVSDYTAGRTRALFSLDRSIMVIHNAVDVPDSFARKSDYRAGKRIVYFGTLAEKKGVLALAEAWRRFHPEFPDWKLVLLGRDASHQGRSVKAMMVERMAEAAAAAEFAGPLDHSDMLRQLSGFDFAVLPSYSEAFALAPMEAMALGLPVIISCMSSGPELVSDGVDGWLCDPREVASVYQAMQRAASDQAAREQVAARALAKIETTFSYPAFVDKNLAFYQTVLAEAGAVT